MVGALDAQSVMTPRLTLSYRTAIAQVDSVLAPKGYHVTGHEFHRTACRPAAGEPPAWQWRDGTEPVADGFVQGGLHASYLHLHWAGHPDIAERFLAACRAARHAGA